jgi:hypothetical protein
LFPEFREFATRQAEIFSSRKSFKFNILSLLCSTQELSLTSSMNFDLGFSHQFYVPNEFHELKNLKALV